MNNKLRVITFYLPQFHPIPENDAWWGKGFTEWTNVAKAKPLFIGHYQPHLPADLGYYDLRVPEVRETQAEMARVAGIEGFCYWHYWFAGKQLLERPFNEVLDSGKPDFPFCLAWANGSWSGIWHGAPDRILIEQTYPGEEDYRDHFHSIEKAFHDKRYITIDGKPLFLVYYPTDLPDPLEFCETWRTLAKNSGLKDIFLLAMGKSDWNYKKFGFDGLVINQFNYAIPKLLHRKQGALLQLFRSITGKDLAAFIRLKFRMPRVFNYEEFVGIGLPPLDPVIEKYPCIYPNWDNTPRSQERGFVLHNSTPELFGLILESAIKQVKDNPPDKQLIFIKSWNEWAEGNYLEPDMRYKDKYLQAIKSMLERHNQL